MTNIIIVHGTCGTPEENWFPWLKDELTKLDCNVFVPKFPTPKNQSLKSWLEVFKDYEKYLDKNTIIVGHSLAPAFLLSVLENLNNPIKAAFFVAGFVGEPLGIEKFDKLNKTFTSKTFNWEKVIKNCKKFFVYSSSNDPYVPISKGEDLAKKLKTKLITIKNAGHFSAGTGGYTTFDILLEKIKSEL